MENLEKKFLEEILNLVRTKCCNTICFSAEFKHIDFFNDENELVKKIQFGTSEETLFAVNMFFQNGFQVAVDCIRKYKIVEDKQVIPLCKED